MLSDERVSVTVPAGSQHAQHIEVEGYGWPRQDSHARGKLVVVLNVTVPGDLSAEDLEAIRAPSRLPEASASPAPKAAEQAEGFFGHRHGRAASAKPKHKK